MFLKHCLPGWFFATNGRFDKRITALVRPNLRLNGPVDNLWPPQSRNRKLVRWPNERGLYIVITILILYIRSTMAAGTRGHLSYRQLALSRLSDWFSTCSLDPPARTSGFLDFVPVSFRSKTGICMVPKLPFFTRAPHVFCSWVTIRWASAVGWASTTGTAHTQPDCWKMNTKKMQKFNCHN